MSKSLSVKGRIGATLVGALLASTVILPVLSAEVTQRRLENSDREPNNWLTTLGNYSSHRFSRLDEVNRDTVKNLRVAFTVPIPSALVGTVKADLQGPPLVVDGMMYFNDGWGTVYKLDVSDGKSAKIVWTTDPAVDKSNPVNSARTRGVALWGNNVYENLTDGRVLGLNGETGEIIWDKQVARTEANWQFAAGESFTAAPLTADGKVLVGQSKGDNGTRGWLAALDVKDGKELWRTFTVPGPGEPGHETWKDDHNAWHTGGGSLWTTGSYDAEQRVTIWGTANPVPMFDPEFRPGDNLFTNSAIAFDINNGKMAWYFQYTPNESWDYDEIGIHFLYDAVVNGEQRKAVGHFGRNGYLYALDRTRGQFIGAQQYVEEINWTKGIDPKTGKPMEYNPTLAVQKYLPATRNDRNNREVKACPTPAGGLRWQPIAYNPVKGIAYAAGADGCNDISVVPSAPVGPQGGNPIGVGKSFLGGTGKFVSDYGSITAMDMKSLKVVAKKILPWQNKSGVLATAGGLIFTGELDGTVTAYNDDNLQALWTFNTGISLKAPAIAYSVGGKEYIAIVAGGDTLTEPYADLKKMKVGAMLYVFSL